MHKKKKKKKKKSPCHWFLSLPTQKSNPAIPFKFFKKSMNQKSSLIHRKHYLDKQESHQCAWRKIFERGEKSWFCLLWDEMLALCSYWEQTRSDTADSHHLFTLPIMFPQADSPQCSGLLLLYCSPLWNYRRALSLCSLKQELLPKIKVS